MVAVSMIETGDERDKRWGDCACTHPASISDLLFEVDCHDDGGDGGSDDDDPVQKSQAE